MAITEDTANQPAAKTWTGAWTSAQTTAAFSPPANRLLVALVSADGGATGVTASVTDSAGGTWALLKRVNTASTAFGTAEVWVRDVVSAPGSITVSVVRATGTAANGGQMTVRTLIGAAPVASQNGATGQVIRDSAGTIQASVTAGTGNRVYGAAYNWTSSTAMTVLGNTTSITAFVDSTNGDNWAAFKSSADTAGTATYGYSTSVQGALAAVQIQAASGSPVTETTTSAGHGWAGTLASLAAGVVAGVAATALAWAGTAATLKVGQVPAATSAAAVWAGTPAALSIGVGGTTTHTGFADGDSTGLTYDADTGAYTLWTAFYANGRGDASAAGVRIWVASGSGAGGTGFTGRLAIKSGGGAGAPDTLLESKAFGTVATDAWTSVLFDAAHTMADQVAGVFTIFWVGVDIPAGHYSYKASVFGSPIQFHDLTGVWLASSADASPPGNSAFGAGSGGQFPTAGASSNGWYGVDPIVTTPGSGDSNLATAPAADAWAGTAAALAVGAVLPASAAAGCWAGTTTTLATGATADTRPAGLAWACVQVRLVADQITGARPVTLAWAGTTAHLTIDILTQARPAAYAWSSAAPVLDIVDVLEGTGPPAVAWAGAPANLNISGGSDTIEPAKPTSIAWAGTSGRLVTTAAAAATPSGHAWSGAPVRTDVDQLSQAHPAGLAWAGVAAQLSVGAGSDVIESGKAAGVAWSGTPATLLTDHASPGRPSSVAWAGCSAALTLGALPGGPATLAWAGTQVGISQGGTPAVVTGMDRPLTAVTATDRPATTVTATDRPQIVVTSG